MPSKATIRWLGVHLGVVMGLLGSVYAPRVDSEPRGGSPLAIFQDHTSESDAQRNIPLPEALETQDLLLGKDRDIEGIRSRLESLLEDHHSGKWVDAYLDTAVDRGTNLRDSWEQAVEFTLSRPTTATDASGAVSVAVQEQVPFTLSTHAIDFGVIHVDESTEQTFTITNPTREPMTIAVTTTTSAPSHRVVSDSTFELAPGTTRAVTLRFQPTGRVLYLANAIVSSDHGNASIILKGIAQ